MPESTVLIVANAYEAERARRAVEKAGLGVLVADGGEGALDLAREGAPSLVVLALGLYAGDAVDILDDLRVQNRVPRLPLIVIADAEASGDEVDAARARGDQIDLWIKRPVDGDELVAHARRLIDRAPPPSELRGLLRVDEAIPDPLAWSKPPPLPVALDVDTLGASALPRIELELGIDTSGPPEPGIAVELPDTGDLDEIGVAALLGRIHRAGFTGRLGLTQGVGERSLFFDSGLPVGAFSTLTQDNIGELLWREGRLTRVDQSRTAAAALASGRPFGEALVALGLFARGELPAALKRHVEEMVYACFAWDGGRFKLGPEVPPGDARVRVATHPYALVVEGVRRRVGLDRLVEKVGPPHTRLHALPRLEQVAAAARLDGPELAAVVALGRQPHTVQTLAAVSGLDELSVYPLAHALLELEALRREDPPHTGDDHNARARVVAKHAQVLDADYFALLGVDRHASAYEIRRAWEQLRRDFAPDRFPASLRGELAAQLADIAVVTDEAYRLLSDERIRDRYRAHLP